MHKSVTQKAIKIYILGFSIFLLLAASGIISYFSLVEFERVLIPEMDKKGLRVGESVQSLIVKSLGYGIPLQKLNGVQEYFENILAENEELEYLSLTDKNGKILFGNRNLPRDVIRDHFASVSIQDSNAVVSNPVGPFYNISFPIINDSKRVGFLHLGIGGDFIQNRIKEISYDILTVLLIAFLLIFELMLLIFSYLINGPMESLTARLAYLNEGKFIDLVKVKSKIEFGKVLDSLNEVIVRVCQRFDEIRTKHTVVPEKRGSRRQTKDKGAATLSAGLSCIEEKCQIAAPQALSEVKPNRIIDIRGLLFLFVFSTMFPISFLPMYVEELYKPFMGLSKELMLSMPFSIYHLFTAIAIAVAGPWSERVGRRRPMVSGAILTVFGYLLTAIATNVFELIAYYSLGAVGLGLVVVACQGYVLDHTPPNKRASAIAMFWAGYFSGTLCGNGIGGILADRIGHQHTFFVASALSLICGILMLCLIKNTAQENHKEKRRVRLSDFKILLTNKQYISILFLLAIPAKICMTGFIFYLVPKFLAALNTTQSTIGRIIMIYSLMFVFVGPYVNGFFEKRFRNATIGTAMTLLAGLALVGASRIDGVLGVTLGVTMYALFRSSCTSSITALILDVCQKEVQQIGSATVVSVSTLFGRIGTILGPAFTGILILYFGYQGAMAGFGITTISGGVLVAGILSLYSFINRQKVADLERVA